MSYTRSFIIDENTKCRDYKLIFVIIASPGSHYDAMKKILLKFMNSYANIKTFFIYGKVNKSEILTSDHDLYYDPVRESLIPGVLDKTILALREIDEKYIYDYVIRSNLSSFFILDRLIGYIETLPKNGCLSGYTYEYWGKQFTSGAGTFMSSDVAKYLYKYSHKLQRTLPDDVAIGYLLSDKFGIYEPDNKRRYDYDRDNPIQITKPAQIPDNYFHYRFKNTNRDLDVINMQYLYKHFYSKDDVNI